MTKTTRTLYAIVAAQSLLAIFGSLTFSNYYGYAPCDLCWYQRICMYPLLILASVAIYRKDTKAFWYMLPLSLIGLFISIFHVTIYTLANHFNTETAIRCSVNGVSCTSRYVEWFGFLSIPVMSFLAFVVTTVCITWIANREK